MKRQYRIMYKRAEAKAFATLEPHIHVNLYDKPEVKRAIEIVRADPVMVGIAVQVGDELFNIITFMQEALAPRSFVFEGQEASPGKQQ